MVNFVNENNGSFGINNTNDELVITIKDKATNTDLQLSFTLDTAVDLCRAIIYHTCMIGEGNLILEIINRIVSNDRPIFNISDVLH